MIYLKSFGVIVSAIILLSSMVVVSAVNASAQTRRTIRVSGGYYRPIVTRRVYYRPFYYSRYYYDPFYDPYYYDPYLRAQRDRYYRQEAVRDAREDLAEHRQKYYADGVLTDKERRKLADDQEDLNKALRRLRAYNY